MIDIDKLEQKINQALDSITDEQLDKWIKDYQEQRLAEGIIDLGAADVAEEYVIPQSKIDKNQGKSNLIPMVA